MFHYSDSPQRQATKHMCRYTNCQTPQKTEHNLKTCNIYLFWTNMIKAWSGGVWGKHRKQRAIWSVSSRQMGCLVFFTANSSVVLAGRVEGGSLQSPGGGTEESTWPGLTAKELFSCDVICMCTCWHTHTCTHTQTTSPIMSPMVAITWSLHMTHVTNVLNTWTPTILNNWPLHWTT